MHMHGNIFSLAFIASAVTATVDAAAVIIMNKLIVLNKNPY